MKRSAFILVIGLLMVSFVSAGNVFFDDFENDVEWDNWVETQNGFGQWTIDDIDFTVGKGNGDFSAAGSFTNGQVLLSLKSSIDLSSNLNCSVSFYSGASCSGKCPDLVLDFYQGNKWEEIVLIDMKFAKDLRYNRFEIDNSYLVDDSSIRFVLSDKTGVVYVDDVSIDCASNDMEVFLDSPDCGDYFMLNDTTEFKIVATDLDDSIAGNISIDGHVVEFNNGGAIFNHTWNRSGNVQVELFAENDKHFKKRKITSVIVVDPKTPRQYLAACMDEPSEFVDIASTNVHFDASSTRGIKNDSGTLEIIEKEDLKFTWSFSDGTLNYVRDGDALDGIAYSFYKNFAIPGDNWAVLDVSLKD